MSTETSKVHQKAECSAEPRLPKVGKKKICKGPKPMNEADYERYTIEKLALLEQRMVVAMREENTTEWKRLKKQWLVRKERLQKRVEKDRKLKLFARRSQ